MKKICFLIGLCFASGMVSANTSLTVSYGSSDYTLEYSYPGDDYGGTAIDDNFTSRDVAIGYKLNNDMKIGVKFGGLAEESSSWSSDFNDLTSRYDVSRDEASIYATFKVSGIPLTLGYYTSALKESEVYSDGLVWGGELKNDGIFISGSHAMPLGDRHGAFAKFGFQTSSVKEDFSYIDGVGNVTNYSDDTSGTAVVFGAGMYYVVNQGSSITASIDKKKFSYDDMGEANLDEEITNMSVAYTVNF
jgi:hypothetical protein